MDTAVAEEPFLSGVMLRKVAFPAPFNSCDLALGQGSSPLEVLVSPASSSPNATVLRSAWKARNAGRAAPLLFVVLHGERASLCGPAGDDPPAYLDLDRGQVERICREALEQPDRHAALRALRDVLPSLESDLAGLRNEGFLATHELRAEARLRGDWEDSCRKARSALAKRGQELLQALGYGIEPYDRVTSILRAGDRKVAVAVLLTREESPELTGERFAGLSPISYALAVADREGLPWVVVQHGAKIRVHPARPGVGVGRRGRTETYIECHAGLIPDSVAAYLWLLCSAEALKSGGSLEQILEASARFAGDLAEGLRERVYQSVVPRLAQGIVAARGLRKPGAQDLADTYEMALTVLFRLLFIAYAEDKDLLPYRWNGLYQRRSLKTKAQELAELARSRSSFDESDDLWNEVMRLCRAVDRGSREWGVPAYQRHGRVDRIGSLHPKVFLRTFFPDEQLDSMLNLEARVRRKLAQAAASVGVEDAPIEHGAIGEQSFAETREEIEKLHREDATIYEAGGTEGAAQTGEEYRQELRRAVEKYGDAIRELPWRAGSGMRKGKQAGHLFCATIAERIYLRFVPSNPEAEIVSELGTCLRLIECTEQTPRVLSDEIAHQAYQSWSRARRNIFDAWTFETDPANLQPKIRKLNREVAAFLRKNPSADIEQDRLHRCLDAIESPWPRREEKLLRLAWEKFFPNAGEKARFLVEEVERIGAEPFHAPEPLPPINADEIHLITWMAIEPENA